MRRPSGSRRAGGRFPVEEVRQSQLKDNTGGWSEELGSLRSRAEEPASA